MFLFYMNVVIFVIIGTILFQNRKVLIVAVCPGILRKEFGDVIENHVLIGPVLRSLRAFDEISCQYNCHADKNDNCLMYNYHDSSSVCELLDGRSTDFKLQQKNGWVFRGQKCQSVKCQNGEKCFWLGNESNTTCACPQTLQGLLCSKDTLKTNINPVCVGAKDDKFGSFVAPVAGNIVWFMLVHLSGGVSFKDEPYKGNWGGTFENTTDLQLHITNSQNQSIAPPPDTALNMYNSLMTYTFPGVTNMDPQLQLFPTPPFLTVTAGLEFRIWFGQDLGNWSEENNQGTTCADVFVRYE